MRTALCFVGFIAFGLILFVALGDVAVDQQWLRSKGQWAWGVAVLLIVSDIAIPVPTTVIITLMGQMYGAWWGGLIGTLGTMLAGLVAYGLTRALGRRFATLLLRDELPRTEQFFRHSGAFAVACSRWLPLIPEAISCLAGLARMPWPQYLVALACGAVPMSFAYAALAEISTQQWIPLLVSILLPVPIWWIAGHLLYRRSRSNDADDGSIVNRPQASSNTNSNHHTEN